MQKNTSHLGRMRAWPYIIGLVGLTGCPSEAGVRADVPPDAPPVVRQSTQGEEPVEQSAEGEVPRSVPLVPADGDAIELRRHGSLRVGQDEVVFFDGRADATSNYAAVRVNDGEPKWLDLRTDADRANGASPESGWGWVHFAIDPGGQTIVGVLDWFVESSGPKLLIVISDDAGRTWSLRAQIDKPHYLATFQSLVMERGRWRLALDLDDCGGCDVAPGAYEWITQDGGFTWRKAPPMPPS